MCRGYIATAATIITIHCLQSFKNSGSSCLHRIANPTLSTLLQGLRLQLSPLRPAAHSCTAPAGSHSLPENLTQRCSRAVWTRSSWLKQRCVKSHEPQRAYFCQQSCPGFRVTRVTGSSHPCWIMGTLIITDWTVMDCNNCTLLQKL